MLSITEREPAGRFDASAVLEHMADGFLAFDGAWTCIYVNAAAEALLGMHRDAVLRRDLWTSPVALAGTAAEPGLRRAMAQRAVVTLTCHFRGGLFDVRAYPLPEGSLAVRLRDITGQRRGEERLALALDATGLGIWDYGVATDTLFWDERTRAICGVSRDMPLEGLASLARVLHPQDRDVVLEAIERAKAGGPESEYAVESRLLGREGGEQRWILSTGRAIFGPTGQCERIVGTKLDITARKRAERQVEQDAERLRLALAATGLGTWDHDVATNVRTWSGAARRLLGLPPDLPASRDLLGRLIHPEDEAGVARAYAAALDPASGGECRHAFRVRRYDDGAERWLAIDGRVMFDDAGRPVRTLGVVRDVTEAQRAETSLRRANESLEARVAQRTEELEIANRALAAERARLWAVLEQLPIGALVVAPAGRVVFQNAAARRMMGRDMSSVREWRDFAGAGAIHPDGGPLSPSEYALVRAVRDGVATFRKLQPFETGDGKRVTFEVSAAPVRGAGGAIELGVLAFEDVTARLEAEEALRRAQRLEAVGQLTGGVAHDFNNLLTAILGNLEILAPRVTEPRDLRLLENAARAADRGARLTAQLLAFARKQRLQTRTVQVDALVQSMAGLLRSTLGGTVEVLLPAPPVRLWPALADPTQLELVVLNLAINARDAMPEGGRLTIALGNVTLGCGTRPEDPPPGNFVALTVTDTGTGMGPAVLERAFEPFFTTKEVGRGSGLGLAQVLGVAQQHGGGVRIASRAGIGTSVTVYLPQAHGVEPAVEAAAAASGGSLAGLSILLADDDADVREITGDLLQEMGASVVPAGNGVEAIERVDSHFSAVVLDFAMPVMTGAECAQHIRQLYPRLPILLVTGHGDATVEPGPFAVLRKPFNAGSLAQAILGALAERQQVAAER